MRYNATAVGNARPGWLNAASPPDTPPTATGGNRRTGRRPAGRSFSWWEWRESLSMG
jgi:hypothetical protein